MHPSLTVARFVILEARRTGLPLLAIAALVAGTGMAGFLSQLALTESVLLQVGVLAAFYRACAIFLMAAFVVTSMVREAGDKGTELLLSMPISRASYYLGKLAGFSVCGSFLAATFMLPMLLFSPPIAVAVWFSSLALEVTLVAAVSLFFVITLGQVVPALAASAGLYLLGRVISAFQAISASPLASDELGLQKIAGWGVEIVALLLPPLDKAAQTAWLLYGPPTIDEFLVMSGALLAYGALVAAAGLFDFHRRNL